MTVDINVDDEDLSVSVTRGRVMRMVLHDALFSARRKNMTTGCCRLFSVHGCYANQVTSK